MHVVFPADPLNARAPYPLFEPQFAAFRGDGHSTSVMPDTVLDGGEPLRRIPTGSQVLYRGWMLKDGEYSNFVTAVLAADSTPFVSLTEYLAAHHLPEWYKLISELTPETRVFTVLEGLEEKLRELDWPSLFVKDFVKSLKTGTGSVVTDLAQLPKLLAAMHTYRGHIEGGICARRLEPLVLDSEVRYFVLRGAAHAPSVDQSIPDLVHTCASRIPSPFFSVDVAARTDGVLRVVEVGDGQVSDLVGWSPERLSAIFRSDA